MPSLDETPPPPGYTTAGATIVAPLEELLDVDGPLPPPPPVTQPGQSVAPSFDAESPTRVRRRLPLAVAPGPTGESASALPWWAFVLFGFVGAWLIAGALTAFTVAVAIVLYSAAG